MGIRVFEIQENGRVKVDLGQILVGQRTKDQARSAIQYFRRHRMETVQNILDSVSDAIRDANEMPTYNRRAAVTYSAIKDLEAASKILYDEYNRLKKESGESPPVDGGKL